MLDCIHGILQDLPQHMEMDVELMEEIQVDVMAKVITTYLVNCQIHFDHESGASQNPLKLDMIKETDDLKLKPQKPPEISQDRLANMFFSDGFPDS